MRTNTWRAVAVTGIVLMCCLCDLAQAESDKSAPKTRIYYIAADEVNWDYAPGGVNKMMGMKFEGYSKVFVEKGPQRIGTVHRKALYREYTDGTFSQLPHQPEKFHPRQGWRSGS